MAEVVDYRVGAVSKSNKAFWVSSKTHKPREVLSETVGQGISIDQWLSQCSDMLGYDVDGMGTGGAIRVNEY